MSEPTSEFWQDIRDSLRLFILKRVSDEAEADDILQEVLLRVQRGIGHLKDSARMTSWLYQITRHAIADHYRHPARRREIPVGLASEVESGGGVRGTRIDQTGAPGELRAQLAGCLGPMIDSLAPAYREALVLVDLNGLTQQAAAKRLGLSLSGVKSRVQRGRRQLRCRLEACCVVEFDRRGGIVDYVVRGESASPCEISEASGCP